MMEQRLSGSYYMFRIHKQKIQDLNLVENVMNEFAKNKNNLEFLFFKFY